VRRAGRLLAFISIPFWCAVIVAGQAARPTAEERTARYMEEARHQPSLLLAFLREMPKGGDLHNHLSGSIYAESWIDFAAEDNLCVDRTTSMLIAPPGQKIVIAVAAGRRRCRRLPAATVEKLSKLSSQQSDLSTAF